MALICSFCCSCREDKSGGSVPQSEQSPIYDSYGFDSSGLHRNGTLYDDAGYDAKGFFRPLVMNMLRFHRNGTLFDQDGYSYFGFDRDLRHRVTGSEFDSDGFNFEGFNAQGVNRRGFIGSNGYLHSDGTLSTYDPDGFNFMGFNEVGIHYLTGAELSDCGVNYIGFTDDEMVFMLLTDIPLMGVDSTVMVSMKKDSMLMVEIVKVISEVLIFILKDGSIVLPQLYSTQNEMILMNTTREVLLLMALTGQYPGRRQWLLI
ncbi:hypothetical protein EBS43_04970 [bacterium]|nr:hypothetical protein [bacterium]